MFCNNSNNNTSNNNHNNSNNNNNASASASASGSGSGSGSASVPLTVSASTGGTGGNSSSSSNSTIVTTTPNITVTPEAMAKLTDRLKLYDDILHRLVPTIKLTDLNDNPKPINPMKLMTALNKLKERETANSKSSTGDEKSSSSVIPPTTTPETAKLLAETYESLPDIPVPHVPTLPKLPPNSKMPLQQAQSQPQSQHIPPPQAQYDSPSSSSDRPQSNSPTASTTYLSYPRFVRVKHGQRDQDHLAFKRSCIATHNEDMGECLCFV
ncbi:unnamed protein product [Ambrosiozyma monospora]|uniref:Unnamed protein product n=1 Tax=Ambrosiozyma monospora TaxID=43982 RepID=A0ACB5TPE8_AMBMO|nr:unnamed protein product [Ambrosiozyma monospora]